MNKAPDVQALLADARATTYTLLLVMPMRLFQRNANESLDIPLARAGCDADWNTRLPDS